MSYLTVFLEEPEPAPKPSRPELRCKEHRSFISTPSFHRLYSLLSPLIERAHLHDIVYAYIVVTDTYRTNNAVAI